VPAEPDEVVEPLPVSPVEAPGLDEHDARSASERSERPRAGRACMVGPKYPRSGAMSTAEAEPR
jgi:hypothetical protein